MVRTTRSSRGPAVASPPARLRASTRTKPSSQILKPSEPPRKRLRASSSPKKSPFPPASTKDEDSAGGNAEDLIRSLTIGDYVLVKPDNRRDSTFDPQTQWIAQIQRFLPDDRVKVAWLNRPDDKPSVRQPYHGLYELILTGHLDDISLRSINGKTRVHQYRDTEQAVHPEELYTRQSCFFHRKLEEGEGQEEDYGLQPRLPGICVEGEPRNPDHVVIKCPAEDCGYSHHQKCVMEKMFDGALDGKQGSWNKLQFSTEGEGEVMCYKCKKTALRPWCKDKRTEA